MSEGPSTLDIGVPTRKKVLVAEDEPGIASLVEDWLSELYEVILAGNGKAALQKAKWNQPDIILVDLMMPDMGGYEVVRALQSDPQTSALPVIAMTAKAFDDSTVKLIKREANVMGFLNKPFQRDSLREKIERVLAGERTFEIPAAPGRPAAPASAGPAPKADESPAAPAGERRWPARLAALALAAAACAASAEFAARLAAADPFEPPAAPGAAGLPYALAADAAWTHGGVDYRTNGWGFRGPAFDLLKRAGAPRVLVLGGASVFGEGVPLEETAAELFRLDAASGDKPAEVIAAGLWGFTAAEQWAYFETAGAKFQPDLVIWFAEPAAGRRPSAAGAAERAKLPSLARRCLAKSAFAALLLRRRWTEPVPPEADFAALAGRARAFAERPDGPDLVILRPGDGRAADGETVFQADALPLGAAAQRRLADALRAAAATH